MVGRNVLRCLHKLVCAALAVAVGCTLMHPTPARADDTLSSHDQTLLRVALDSLIGRAVSGAGWRVSMINATLDLSTLQRSASRVVGRGTWTLGALDDQQKTSNLEGPLDFEVTGLQPGSLPAITTRVKGTLRANQVEFLIEAAHEANQPVGTSNTSENFTLQLKRDGQTSNISANATTDTRLIAYNLLQSTTRTTAERDGQQVTGARTLIVRALGSGEDEFWLQMRVDDVAHQNLILDTDQHFYQRAVGAQQFYDRYDMQLLGKTYSLQSPAGVSLRSDGQLTSDLVLVDENGKPLTAAAPRQTNRQSDTRFIRYDKADGANGATSPGGMVVPMPVVPIDPADICGEINSPLGSLAFGIGISAVVALGVALAAPGGVVVLGLAETLGCALVSTAIGQAVSQRKNDGTNPFIVGGASVVVQAIVGFGCGGVGGAIGNAIGAAASAGCNADPFFVEPNRPFMTDEHRTGPVQITRITGGLVNPDTAAKAGSAVGSSPVTQLNNDYDDRPEAFVGDAVPGGATAMGEWKWDTDHSFGAAASHTQSPVEGPQKQYFLHVSNPLQVGSDDNIVQYIYLDPKNPPTELYLQFYTGDGDGEHRVYWGVDQVQTGGKPGTASLYPMGALPSVGSWVRLKVPADKVGLAGKSINGILYGAYGGQTWWGPTTTSSRLTDRAPDALSVAVPDSLPTSEPGAQIAYLVTRQTRLTIEIADSSGSVVRTLRKDQDTRPGYHVEVWDGKNDSGAPLPDKPYSAHFRMADQIVADATISLSPFVANIVTPSAYSLIRGNDIPVIGEAFGPMFSRYVLEYGEGLNPVNWKPITAAESPVLLPKSLKAGTHAIGNLANWDVGVNEFEPWHNAGLNGVYTLRLRVIGKDGREVSASVPVIVGRLAHSAEGGTITSPDGQARLVIPPLATQSSFDLMALIPASQIEPDGTWKASLPADKNLAGEVYEVFPADAQFRRPALLELPYAPSVPPEKVGVLLGDGQTWRYIGGKADPARKVVSVAVTEFGGQHALVAPFSADRFDPAQPIRMPGQPLSFAPNAPLVASNTHPAAFYDDFASTIGEVAALDQFGTQLSLVRGAETGLPGDNAALKVTHLSGGVRLVRLRSTPYDASKYPMLSFDYRLPPGYTPNILIRGGEMWWQLKTGSQGWASSPYYQTLRVPDMIADDAWHHYQIDVLALLRAQQAHGKPPVSQVDEVALGQVNSGPYMQVTPGDSIVSSGQDSYYIANVAALAPVADTKPALTLSPAPGKAYTGYSAVLDQQATTIPPEQDQGMSPGISLPPDAPDGLWYVHVRGKTPDGNWSATAHYPLLIDRQAPTFGQPAPAPDGADVPTVITVPILDVGGVDPGSIRFNLNGQRYTVGPSARYDPLGRILVIYPYWLEPPLPPVPNGQKVTVAITALSDYAGNKATAPFTWRFTADQPGAHGSDFRALTLDGETPALSPDASQVAFVSKRTGVDKIWIVRADDYDEKTKRARPLIAGNAPAHESDPAWSPDGKLLAYISDANGHPQVWVAGADGSGAHALSAPGGSVVASPTWSPDGKIIAFIQDGNLWQINADGSTLRPLTTLPDGPYQSVRWQPGGSRLALAFNLYEQRIELYDTDTGSIQPLTHGGKERQPAWLNGQTVLYTAPVGQGQPDGIWETSADGSGQAILAGSGQPAVDDMQADTSANGNATAIVSTRSGARRVWVRSVLQLSQFSAEPTNGAAAGKPILIRYVLPVQSDVTLQVVNASGAAIKVLVDKTRQSSGSQLITWNGDDANHKPVAAGAYMVRLTAQPVTGGNPLERLTTVRVLDPTTIGSLQIQVNQWTGQPFQQFDGQVRLYPQGIRSRPVAAVDSIGAPTFELPAGSYDAVVTLGDLRREVQGITVQPGKTVSQAVDLGFGGLTVTVLSAPGQPVTGNAFITVTHSDDLTRTPVRYGAGSAVDFVLPPGRYDVKAEYQGVRQVSYGLQVTVGQVAKQEVNLGSGLLQMTVLASSGTPMGQSMVVEAFRPEDHKTAVAATFGLNPLQLRLPAGIYDLRVSAPASSGSRLNVAADIIQWFNGVQIRSGETLTQTNNLHLGEVQIQIFEAAGKPADEKLVSFCVVPQGQRDCTNRVLYASGVSSVQALLPVGVYAVIPDYSGTSLRDLGPAGASFEVKEGQRVTQTISLKLGRVQVQILDASGQPIKFERLQISAFLPGKRETREAFSHAISLTPVDLIIQAGVPYDIEIILDGAKRVILAGQTVNEGETRRLTLRETEFK